MSSQQQPTSQSHNQSSTTSNGHEPPRVCIVGGGWAGIQALQSLRELGIESDLFESYHSLGGTFAVGRGYPGLALHSQRRLAQLRENGRFFPFAASDLGDKPDPVLASKLNHQSTGHDLELNSEDFLNAKPSGDELGRYIVRFAKEMGLDRSIHLNSCVEEIQWEVAQKEGESPKRDTWVFVKSSYDSSEATRFGPYDIVYFASAVSKPNTPNVTIEPPKNDSGQSNGNGETSRKVKVMHHWDLTQEAAEEMMEKKKRIVVLGSGKGSNDAVCLFIRHGYKDKFEWLAREPYFLWHYDTFLPVQNGGFVPTLISRLRGIAIIVAFICSIISGKLFMVMMWLLGCVFQPRNEKDSWLKRLLGVTHLNDKRFNFGLVCKAQLPILMQKTQIVGDIDYLQESTVGHGVLVLKDERRVPCDVLICATGYGSGIEKIKFVKVVGNGSKTQQLVLGTDLPKITYSQCYDHMTAVDFPPLVCGITCLVAFGPIRGVFQAAYIAHRIKCKYSNASSEKREWDQHYMKAICNRYLFQPNILFETHPGFSSTWSLPRTWVAMFLDLVRFGQLSVIGLLSHFWGVFGSSQYLAPQLLGAENPK